MKNQTTQINKISKVDLQERLDEVLEKVQNGHTILITDHGQNLAAMIPAPPDFAKQPVIMPRLLTTKEEFFMEMKRLEEAYQAGRLKVEDCFLSKSKAVDMGITHSSNLDPEIYE